MSHLDNPARPRQTHSSDIDRVTPAQRHHLRGSTLPSTAAVIASKRHRTSTWSPGQVPDVENIPSDARAGLLPKGAQRPIPPSAAKSRTTTSQDLAPNESAESYTVPLLGNSASNVPKLSADGAALSFDGTGGSLQALTPNSSSALLHVSASTTDTSSNPGISSVSFNASDDQPAAPVNPLPDDTQPPHEDTNAEAEGILPTPTLSRPNHSYLSSEAIHSPNQAAGGTSEITLAVPIVAVNQEPGTSTPDPHHWGFFKGLRHKWRRWRLRWKLWCFLAMVIAVSLGIPIGFALRIRDISIPNTSDAANNSNVSLSVTLVTIDPDKKTATFDWFVDNADCNSDPCEDYDIFFNQNLLASDTGRGSNNNIPSEPVFSINGTLFNDVLRDEPKLLESALQNFPFFTTKISLVGGENRASKERTLQAYPFDRYEAVITIFAKIKKNVFDPNDLVTISISSSDGIAVGFTATLADKVNDGGFAVGLDIDIARGMVVRIYCVIIVIAIWLVTLTLLSVTISVVLLRREMAKGVMIVPVTTLFAFTQLRGTFPGAPTGFGAIVDFMGVLPCLAILSLCSVLLLAVFLFYDPENPRARKDKSDPESKLL